MKQNSNLIFQKHKAFITNTSTSVLDNSNSSKIHTGKKMHCPTTQGPRFLILWCRAVILEHVFSAEWLQCRSLPPFTALIDEFWQSVMSLFPAGADCPLWNLAFRWDAEDRLNTKWQCLFSDICGTIPVLVFCFTVFYFLVGPREDHKWRSTQHMSKSLIFQITLTNLSIKHVYPPSLTNMSSSQPPLGNY